MFFNICPLLQGLEVQMVKNLSAVLKSSLITGPGRSPVEGNGCPLQYSVLGEFHGQKSPTVYKPMGSQRVGQAE